jgi:hypothetical protein
VCPYACIRSNLLKNSPNSKRPKTNPISPLLIPLPSSHPCPCPQRPLHTRRRTGCHQPPLAGEPEDRPRHRCHPQLAVYHLSSSCPPSRARPATPSLSSVLLQISATAGCCDEERHSGGSGQSCWRGNGMTCSHTPGRGRRRLAPPDRPLPTAWRSPWLAREQIQATQWRLRWGHLAANTMAPRWQDPAFPLCQDCNIPDVCLC